MVSPCFKLKKLCAKFTTFEFKKIILSSTKFKHFIRKQNKFIYVSEAYFQFFPRKQYKLNSFIYKTAIFFNSAKKKKPISQRSKVLNVNVKNVPIKTYVQ
jgi:hypothetical protein